MKDASKNRGGRPPSKDPRFVRQVVKLTESEATELARIAAVAGVTASDVLRSGIRPEARSQAPRIARGE